MDRYNRITTDPSRAYVDYDAVTINILTQVSDFDVKASTSLFDRIKVARELVLRTTRNIAIRLNETSKSQIDILKNEGFNLVGVPVENIFISTTNQGAVVRIVIVGWN